VNYRKILGRLLKNGENIPVQKKTKMKYFRKGNLKVITMNYLKPILAITIVALFSITGCKKEDAEDVIPEITVPTQAGSNDETAREEYDDAVDDIFDALENTGLSTGRTSSSGVILPCGVVKIDSTGGSYRFVYDSTSNCRKRILSGSITASLITGSKWEDKGAQIQLLFTNYKVFFVVNNQTLTFNGPLTITNRDGGKLWNVLTAGGNKVIIHTVSGTISITFNNNIKDKRAWTITKKRTFQSSTGTFAGLTWTLEADGPNAEVGTAKNGTPFTTTIPRPIVWENCSPTGTFEGPYKATVGELMYNNQGNYMKAEAGYYYDVSAKKEVLVNDCTSDGYKLTFFINGVTTTSFQYY